MWILIAALLSFPTASATQEDTVAQWLTEQAVPLDSEKATARFIQSLGSVRVIGLGEATHGQHECFEFKRRVTLQLIREEGFRLVAYEASATGAQALNHYVQGQSDDLQTAMRGFGMMIWGVEENRALLEDLRAWNEKAAEGERVEIIGIDVQDASGAAEHLHGLLENALPKLAQEARAVAEDLLSARNAAYEGKVEDVALAQERLRAFSAELSLNWGHIAALTSRDQADEALRCARELTRFPVDPSDRGMRDRGLGQTLLDAIAARPEGTKAVVWGHNGHITKGPLRSMGTEDPGAGGHLRAALGDAYYALGVAFGSGGFQALHRDEDGKWWFRRYEHGAAPTETVGHVFQAAGLGDALVNLRNAPAEGPVREWLDGSCGVRSWGGYGVPEDPEAANEQGQGLAWTIPSEDYDGLLFLEETTSARPVNTGSIWK